MKFTDLLKQFIDDRQKYTDACDQGWASKEYLNKLYIDLQLLEDQINSIIEIPRYYES